jgi:hypothetical protein
MTWLMETILRLARNGLSPTPKKEDRMDYVIVFQDCLFSAHRDEGETTVVPPGASLISQTDWNDMCTAAGGEQNLKSNLGIIADYRS